MKKYNSNASQPEMRTHDGQEYLVVPVVMARAGVEMNGGVITEDQLHAASWNGVPVTVGHPKDDSGNDISANSPDVLERYQVGTIFNAKVESGKLKAEAWVNTSKADSDLIERLQAMDSMDVSTGYFSDIQGNQYKDIKPDHLALLPNEEGACNYQDGCGVRSNEKKKNIMEKFYEHMKQFFNNQPDKVDNEPNNNKTKGDTAMVDELISNEATPFSEDDKESLEAMSECSLKALKEKFQANEDDKDDSEEVEAQKSEEEEPETNKKEYVLSNEDKEALAEAKEIVSQKREEYITHITANSSFESNTLKEKSTKDLKELATNINPTANFAGRAMGQPKANGSSNEEAIKAMQTPSTAEIIKNKREVN